MFKYFILAAIFVLHVQAQGQQLPQLNSDEEIKKFISDNPHAVIEIKGKTEKRCVQKASSNRIKRSARISPNLIRTKFIGATFSALNV